MSYRPNYHFPCLKSIKALATNPKEHPKFSVMKILCTFLLLFKFSRPECSPLRCFLRFRAGRAVVVPAKTLVAQSICLCMAIPAERKYSIVYRLPQKRNTQKNHLSRARKCFNLLYSYVLNRLQKKVLL